MDACVMIVLVVVVFVFMIVVVRVCLDGCQPRLHLLGASILGQDAEANQRGGGDRTVVGDEQLGDRVAVVDAETGIDLTGVVDALTIPLDADGAQSVTVRTKELA
jgi:hypothetical protein